LAAHGERSRIPAASNRASGADAFASAVDRRDGPGLERFSLTGDDFSPDGVREARAR